MSENIHPSLEELAKVRREGHTASKQYLSPAAGRQKALNYSFQTGEEFADEFMKERVAARRPYIPVISEEQSTESPASPGNRSPAQTAFSGQQKRQKEPIGKNWRDQFYKAELVTPDNNISQGSNSSSNDSTESNIKFLCSFGGKFLPRPSDGMLRYVGGEKHIIHVNKNMAWQELKRKTTKLFSKAHIIKYQLSGDHGNVMISVSSDEDLHHMIDEWSMLESHDETAKLFLIPADDADHHDVQFGGARLDREAEAQYMAAVNGLADVTEDRSISAIESSHLQFDIDEDGSTNDQSEEGSITAKNGTFVRGVTTHVEGSSRLMPENLSVGGAYRNEKKPNYQKQIKGSDASSYIGSKMRYSAQNTTDQLASSVPRELKNPTKQNEKTVSKPPINLQRTVPDGPEKLQSPKRMSGRVLAKDLISLDDLVLRTPTPAFQGKDHNPVLICPSPSRVSQGRRTLKEQHEPLIQLYTLDDADRYEETSVVAKQAKSPGAKIEQPGPHLSARMSEINANASQPDREKQVMSSKDEASKSADITLLYKINEGTMPQKKMFSREDLAYHEFMDEVTNHRVEESFKRSFELPKTLEKSDSKKMNLLKESFALIHWHDDMNISLSSYNQEWNSSDDSKKQKKSPLGSNIGKSDRSAPVESERVQATNLTEASEKKAAGPHPRNHNSNEQALNATSGSSKKDKELPPKESWPQKILRSRSLNTEDMHHQGTQPVQDAKGIRTAPVLELEEHEAEDGLVSTWPLAEATNREFDIGDVQIIQNEDLEDLRELGSGAFGTVFHGKWRGTDVAIKRLKNSYFDYKSPRTEKLLAEFYREARILSKLHHPNVLAFYGIVKNGPGGTVATVTEYMVSGSLKKVLMRKDKFLDRRKRIMLAKDAAIGMEYLHSKNIIHFDLKSDNLLVNLKDPSRPICKVADFGLAKMKENTWVSGGMRGTLPWMAPECLAPESQTTASMRVSEKVDVYSFGIVMWEILTGEEPYSGMHHGAVFTGILYNNLRPPIPDSCDPEWKKLMEHCWMNKPEHRPTFTEIAARLRAMLEATQALPSS